MASPFSESDTILQTPDRRQCMEFRLVLDAVGIPSRPYQSKGSWYLEVAQRDAERALSELQAYQQENPPAKEETTSDRVVQGDAVPAVIAYGLVLIAIAVLESYQAYGLDWMQAGQMQADLVCDGQWWRAITALTLHVDLGHLMSNLVFGVVFGLMAGRTLGGGVAWLSIVLAGGLGNLVNAYIQEPDHTSIGASTAVFAALGLLVAHALRFWGDRTNRWKRWRPLIGGTVLLGLIGVGGERTDVAAHFTGFLAGLLIGWLGSYANQQLLTKPLVQHVSGIAAIATIVIAWFIASR
ncbi:MAG: rhomboid family intramembrane serine protease [Planctomycetota bacterium]